MNVMSWDHNARWSQRIETGKSTFEGVGQLKYLGTTLTNQNSVRVEIKRRLNSRNAFYHLMLNLLCSSLLSKNIKIKIYRTIILPVVFCGCETWSLTLREEHRSRVFEKRVLRRIFGRKRDEVTGSGENYIMRSSMICTPHNILFGWSNWEEWDGWGM